MNSRKHSLIRGMVSVSPLMLGVIPFGLICGASAVHAGLSMQEAVGMSVVVFAGASQLAVTQLMASDATWWVILFTGIVINLRMLLYSASIANFVSGAHTWKKFGIAYLLTDQAYATSLQEYQREKQGLSHRCWFYFGVAGLMWVSFVVSTAMGAMLGNGIPPEWDLGFSVPLTFVALLMNTLKDDRFGWAALIAGLLAVGLYPLPFNLGMLLAALVAIMLSSWIETAWRSLR
ncbi:MAG: AzlC family ABC transporter permease [Puniceicoccaceae bacterium]